jgi:hypothetical protein
MHKPFSIRKLPQSRRRCTEQPCSRKEARSVVEPPRRVTRVGSSSNQQARKLDPRLLPAPAATGSEDSAAIQLVGQLSSVTRPRAGWLRISHRLWPTTAARHRSAEITDIPDWFTCRQQHQPRKANPGERVDIRHAPGCGGAYGGSTLRHHSRLRTPWVLFSPGWETAEHPQRALFGTACPVASGRSAPEQSPHEADVEIGGRRTDQSPRRSSRAPGAESLTPPGRACDR